MDILEKCQYTKNEATTIDRAMDELVPVYSDFRDRNVIKTMDAYFFKWDITLINKLRYLMSTDIQKDMSKEDEIVWNMLVYYEDTASTSADEGDCNGLAIGCTNPNNENESYVVRQDGVVMDGTNGLDKILCSNPVDQVQHKQEFKDLDKLLHDMVTCAEDRYLTDFELIDINECKGV
jgi:hypothetical protein